MLNVLLFFSLLVFINECVKLHETKKAAEYIYNSRTKRIINFSAHMKNRASVIYTLRLALVV